MTHAYRPSNLFYAVHPEGEPENVACVDISIPGGIAVAHERTGRPRSDFAVREITQEEYERLRPTLGPEADRAQRDAKRREEVLKVWGKARRR